jgi:23S rRNA (guanine745-N1)-methyltransferase
VSLRSVADLLACPVCAEDLTLTDRTVRCPAGHSFDQARQGYVNLLRGKPPANADTADMVAARERFLGGGHYEPVADALAARVAGDTLLEAGAGTGYYLAHILSARPTARGLATDISVPAVRRAARAHPCLSAVVADTWAGLPVRTGVIDSLLCVFAPRNMAEFHRVLRPGGRLLVATPLPHHLEALRTQRGLLDIDAHLVERLTTSADSYFVHTASTAVERTISLPPQVVDDLVGMGPNAFHAAERTPGGSTADDARAADTPVTVAVRVDSFERIDAG